MKAVVYHGTHDVRVQDVPESEIVDPRDAIVKVTATAICGSDLHLYDGFVPAMEAGRGHEPMARWSRSAGASRN
jgi:threonine dehydrogenase-like Zn-dependent dehydrogenase